MLRKHPLKSSPKNKQRNEWPLTCRVFCRVHWVCNCRSRGLMNVIIIKPNTTSLTSSCSGPSTCSSAETSVMTQPSKQSHFTSLFLFSIILRNTCLHTKLFVLIHYIKNRMQHFQISCNADTYLVTKIFWQAASLFYTMHIWEEKLWVIFPKIW
jgi:hypothetical protein